VQQRPPIGGKGLITLAIAIVIGNWRLLSNQSEQSTD